MNSETIKKVLTSRAIRVIKKAQGLLDTGEFYIAGGCIASNEFNDIDVYPVKDKPFLVPKSEVEIIARTKNASTIKKNNVIIQFCEYKKDSLEELVNSFDFAHIKVGAYVVNGSIKDVYYHDTYETAKIIESSFYTNSEYPFSSLIRILKYHKREQITKTAAIRSIINIVHDIVKRGFKNYEDFKDQLDAIDLGMVPEELEELEYQELKELYELLLLKG